MSVRHKISKQHVQAFEHKSLQPCLPGQRRQRSGSDQGRLLRIQNKHGCSTKLYKRQKNFIVVQTKKAGICGWHEQYLVNHKANFKIKTCLMSNGLVVSICKLIIESKAFHLTGSTGSRSRGGLDFKKSSTLPLKKPSTLKSTVSTSKPHQLDRLVDFCGWTARIFFIQFLGVSWSFKSKFFFSKSVCRRWTSTDAFGCLLCNFFKSYVVRKFLKFGRFLVGSTESRQLKADDFGWLNRWFAVDFCNCS